MSSSKSLANGSALAQSATSGRTSASFEKHRRQSSSSGGGDVSMVKLAHSQSRSRSHSRSASGASGSGNLSGHGHGTIGAAIVSPPPKERLLPSPPLTPVASLSSLRKTAATRERERVLGVGADVVVDVVPKSGKVNLSSKGVALDRSELVDGGSVAERDTTTLEDGVDTEGDGALSSWSFRPDGGTSTEAGTITNATTTTTDTATTTDDCGTDDNSAGLALPFTSDDTGATPTTAIGAAAAAVSVQPSSGVSVSSLSHSHDIPQGLIPPPSQERGDPLSVSGTGIGDDVSGEAHKAPPASSSMPPGHETTSPTPMPPHPLYNNGPSPQPWDLVEPPPDNNEEIMRRVRKDSNRSMPASVVNVVVKDGKKYRIPHSSYYFGPPPDTSAFGTDPIGHIGVHHPREIIRIERDYSGGDLAQFTPAYPLELEGRITPTQFLQTINDINETLLDAHTLRWSFLDNALAVLTLYISRLFIESNYDRKMRRLKELIEKMNKELYNPAGLNILWPKDAAFMFLEIEYY